MVPHLWVPLEGAEEQIKTVNSHLFISPSLWYFSAVKYMGYKAVYLHEVELLLAPFNLYASQSFSSKAQCSVCSAFFILKCAKAFSLKRLSQTDSLVKTQHIKQCQWYL